MLNLLRNSINVLRKVSGLDSDASAFITAAGLTDATQKDAINTLVKDMKAAGLWTKMKAVYPMVGGTATSMKFNLKDPRDLDAAFRLTWSGGWTYSATGAKGNGTNNFATTYFNNASFNDYNSTSIYYYGNGGVNTGSWDIGNINSTPNTRITISPGTVQLAFQFNSANISTYTLSSLNGLVGMNRISSSQVNAFFNNTKIATVNEAVIANANANNFVIGSQFSNGFSNNSDRLFKFVSFGAGLSDQESLIYNQIVEKYQVALSRGVQAAQSFYYNSAYSNEANTYLYSTQITGTTQVSAINTLINGLKANNLWTKMKAVYPFVTDKTLQADMAAQMKFNLVNPQDTDAAFRLAFSGGWTYSTNGAQPNGTNGYADTKLVPSTSLSTSSAHLSFYSRTNSPSGGYTGYELANGHYALITQFQGNKFYPNLEAGGSYAAVYTSTNGLGHFIASRLNNTTVQGFKNGLKVVDSALASSLAASSLSISSRSGVGNYSDKQAAFASIGDGLTDAEALALYNLIQQFQTDLSRQV
jgi:hypothetical protein